ncbi:hypothetical protein ACSBR2_035789 [Camellia fascicularis]
MNGKSNESNVDDEPDLLAKFYPHVDKTPKNPRAGSDLVSDVIAERVCDKPLTRPTDVVYNLKKYYGLEVSYRVTWLGVKKTHGEMFGAHSILFDQLRWYSNVVMDNNPGSYINIDYDEQNNHFIRYFISFKACIDGFNHCRPLLFLDGTFLKGKFKENLLAATAKDGSQVVAIRNSGKDLYELVDLYYHVTEYRSLYAYNIIPIPTIKKPPFNAEDFVI